MRIIFDCDPGLDDGVALLAAFGEESFDMKAITTVFGCSQVENTTQNAIDLLKFIGREDVKVGKGSDRSMEGICDCAAFVHGEDGFKNITIPRGNKSDYNKTAMETIYDVLTESNEKTHIIATGPLTNIGKFIVEYPELKEKIEGISIMGGAIGMGNKSPVAEANIYNDPIAAKIVFDSGIPIIMSGLNVTFKATINKEEMKEIRDIGSPIANLAADFLEGHFEFYEKQGFLADPIHDLCAVASLAKKDLFEGILCHVDIETKGEFTKGQTVVDLENKYNKPKNTFVCLEVNRKEFFNFLKERVIKLS